MSPRPSLIPDLSELQTMQALSPEHPEPETTTSSPNQNHEKNEPKTTANRASSCRVCLKSFKPDDFSKTCFECKYRVCEDCASYSKVDSAEDLVSRKLHRQSSLNSRFNSLEHMAMQRLSKKNVVTHLHSARLDRLKLRCACLGSFTTSALGRQVEHSQCQLSDRTAAASKSRT